ncbi:MAG: hypothetical protein DMF56_02285 [Acidobacteria bacterium]|nr:MAG: hypothetical protein DMF56_02285 [Acidobacteriota bacterium]
MSMAILCDAYTLVNRSTAKIGIEIDESSASSLFVRAGVSARSKSRETMMTKLRRSLFPSLFAMSIMLLTVTAVAQNKIVRAGKDKIENEYIVVLQDDVLPQQVPELARQIASAHGTRAEKIWQYTIKAFFVRMSEERAEQLSRHPLVKYVEENARWYLSASQQTNVNSITCDPAVNCPVVDDNRLWHLDRADQNYASSTNRYSYTSDGTNVTVYVVDTGVNKNHQEFAGSGRVQAGFNATGDLIPADDPCMGFAAPLSVPAQPYEQSLLKSELLLNGHGTAVASALGGRRTGIAKNVTIVPIKVAPCDGNSGRQRQSSHFYQQNQIMYHSPNSGANSGVIWRAMNSGTTAATDPGDWPNLVGTVRVDGTITWKAVLDTISTTDTIIAGLDWILSPSNPGPKSYAVVTLSTYKLATDLQASGVEQSIKNLLANNITVIASANNQNGNACDTTPGRMSINNPDSNIANNVITAGGTMIINRPWTVDISDVGGNVADGPNPNGFYGLEPAYDSTKAVRDGRWICGAGDSSEICSNTTAIQSGNPGNSSNYYFFQGGSNAGPCVTLFAPAKNLFVASIGSANSYRDARVRGGHASGTSWSAPIVAGFAARLLQNNPTFTPVQMRTALLNNSVGTLDAATLNTFDYQGQPISGTPNKLLKLSDVNITSQPVSVTSSGPATLTVIASGTSALSYQWYQVSSGFDLATYNYGAHSSTPIAGATASTFTAPVSSTPKSYWVRVTNAGGSADSTIATVTPGQQCVAGMITQQPQSQTIIPGASATISVAVSGTGPFNYQFYQAPVGFYQNPTGISTATINTGPLVTTKQYWAEINDTCQGTLLRSDAAVITVQCTAAPMITQQPTSRVTSPGQSTTLSVSATQAVSYQWYQGNSPSTATPISGAINSTLTVAPQSTTNYWVRVMNGCGNADSVTATVCVLPGITAQPTPRIINPGQSTTLTVTAINATSYQWYQGTAPSTATPVGTNSNSLTVTPAATTSYWVRVSNSCGSVDSNTVVVTVAPAQPPQITRLQSASSLANSQTSITANWPQPTQAGTFLVAVVSVWLDPYANFTAPAGWSHAVTSEWNNVKVAIYYRPNNPGARTSETFTCSPGYHDMTLYILEYAGIAATNPLDKTALNGAATNNGYVQTGFTANTTQAKELVITALTTYTQTEFTTTPADGYTEVYDQYMLYHLTTAMYEKITTAIGSYGHGATVGVPAEYVGAVATFKGAN